MEKVKKFLKYFFVTLAIIAGVSLFSWYLDNSMEFNAMNEKCDAYQEKAEWFYKNCEINR